VLILRYSARELLRHPIRSGLAILGVAVACAMLLDMLMLGGGLNSSFESLLTTAGYELRVAPAGTLPFDTGATISNLQTVRTGMQRLDAVDGVAPVLGANLLFEGPDRPRVFVLGVDPADQGIYRLEAGEDLRSEERDDRGIVIDRDLVGRGLAIGDTIVLRAPGSFADARSRRGEFTIVGVADFLYSSVGERSAAVSLGTLAEITDQPDEASLMMVRLTEGADPEAVVARLRSDFPGLEIASVGQLVERAAQRLSYFRQLAVILGTVSLIVTTLLIGTIMAISINDRYGTIAALRAIGISRRSLVAAFALESLLLSLAAAAIGLALGLLVAGQLESILSDFPGLPAAIRFFVLEPGPVGLAATGVIAAGVLAALVPAIRAMNAPIATTLHREEP
jgi:putative ABC transport system permease protein